MCAYKHTHTHTNHTTKSVKNVLEDNGLVVLGLEGNMTKQTHTHTHCALE